MKIDQINAYRAEIMGVATLMVYIGHVVFFGRHIVDFGPMMALRFGYSGVDVFLFLSGIGLYHSMQRNSVATFYKNRVSRLLPTVILSMITYCLLNYNIGYFIFNPLFWFGMFWFVGFIIIAYAIYPLIYKFANHKWGGVILPLTIVLSALLYYILYNRGIGYSNPYSCAATRIPIFALGVVFAASKAQWLNSRNVWILGILGVVLIYLFTLYCQHTDRINLNAHYAMFFTTPVVIWCLTRTLPVISPKIRRVLAWLGTLSLQIYMVQIIVMGRYFSRLLIETNVYIASLLVFAIVLIISVLMDKAHRLVISYFNRSC